MHHWLPDPLLWFGLARGKTGCQDLRKIQVMFSTFPSFQTVLSQCPSVDICFLLGVPTCRTNRSCDSLGEQPFQTGPLIALEYFVPLLCSSHQGLWLSKLVCPSFQGEPDILLHVWQEKGWCFPEVAAPLEQGGPHFPLGQRCPNLPFVLTFYASHLPAASGEFLCRAFSLSNQSMVGCILKDWRNSRTPPFMGHH